MGAPVPVEFYVNDGTHQISTNLPPQPRGTWVHLAFVVECWRSTGGSIPKSSVLATGGINRRRLRVANDIKGVALGYT
jgi:hypothetical protein